MAKSGATEVDLEIGDVKLSIKSLKRKGGSEVIPNQYLPPIQTPPVQVQQASIQSTPPVQSIEPVEQISQDAGAETQDESNYITFSSDYGTFTEDPSEKDAFGGDTVSEG